MVQICYENAMVKICYENAMVQIWYENVRQEKGSVMDTRKKRRVGRPRK